jgi:hypothetical protein
VSKHVNYVCYPFGGCDAEIQRETFIVGRAAETGDMGLQPCQSCEYIQVECAGCADYCSMGSCSR